MLGSTGPSAMQSVAGYMELQNRSGVTFLHEAPGFLEISPGSQQSDIITHNSCLNFDSFFGPAGYKTNFESQNRGWINPTELRRAFCVAAESTGRLQ